ncbi:glutathione S-transferase family protein [Pseudooceanicola lipolyticus]|uniref:Glutathione S-transferase family protein n=1 Tax=Pseudooceanicola lipolyticus TaxID=2029104 RepID=A0A2M8J7B5_9RHOB|nr:glutathione S-transferase family protein [Pseudooceanicola lipolyticus]PJE38670.1 glutathione S-transferase family protein [Pseudooceanicola lipolyticus]
MPHIEPKDQTLKTLEGLHLWHAPMSSCSQRVRLVLAETGRDWESHPVDLEKDEHATPEYQAIHPKGLVPAFVDNGDLIIESIDIIQHVAGEGSALAATDAPELLQLADAAQVDLKLLTFEFLFRAAPPPSAEAAEAFQRNHGNDWLKQFRRDFAAGFDRDRLDQAVTRTDDGFRHLDALLSDGRPFLAGDSFSLADIAWMPNVHRFALMGWPFERTPHLADWFERVKARDSYRTALLDWQNEHAAGAFAAYTGKRRAEGSDIRAYGSLNS